MVPQTEGTLRWEAAHVGAEEAVQGTGAFIYWNAPMRDGDVEAQIAVVDRIASGNYKGLVLAPDQALALVTPVRRAVARGIPVVIIASPLDVPPGGNLFYVVNDDAVGGRIAAERVAEALHGSGSVAILGVDPDFAGILERVRIFESVLAARYPHISVIEKRLGSPNAAHEQQVAQETIDEHPHLDMIVAMNGSSIDGALSALSSEPSSRHILLVGFDTDNPANIDNPHVVCIIQEDTRSMGRDAVRAILDKLDGRPVQPQTLIPPVVITRSNLNSAQVVRMWSQDWTLGRMQWSRLP